MKEQYQNGFCPYCGALLRNGVCPCCQFGADVQGTDTSASGSRQDPYGNPYSYDSQNQNIYGSGNQNYSQNAYGSGNQNNSGGAYGYVNQESFKDSVRGKSGGGNKNYKATAAIVAALLSVFTIIVCFLTAAYAIHHPAENNTTEQGSGGNDFWDYDQEYGTDSEDNQEDYFSSADTLAQAIDWDDTSWKNEKPNCTPDELWDKKHRYYEDFRNCIHEDDVSYKIIFKTEEQLDKSKNVCMRATYYQLEGDIPNLDEINRRLKDTACRSINYYNDNPETIREYFEDCGEVYIVSAASYITYHDEAMLSMAVDNRCTSAADSGLTIDCITVDLETGMVLDNTEIIDPTEDFVKTVKERSAIQNGTVSFLDEVSVGDLQEMFDNKDDLIIFYTPCGLEVGLNYASAYYGIGWVTTTLTDYEQYLKSY